MEPMFPQSEDLGVFEVVAVDRRSCKLVYREFHIASNEGAALALMEGVDKQKVAENEIAVWARPVGRFTPIRPIEIKNTD